MLRNQPLYCVDREGNFIPNFEVEEIIENDEDVPYDFGIESRCTWDSRTITTGRPWPVPRWIYSYTKNFNIILLCVPCASQQRPSITSQPGPSACQHSLRPNNIRQDLRLETNSRMITRPIISSVKDDKNKWTDDKNKIILTDSDKKITVQVRPSTALRRHTVDLPPQIEQKIEGSRCKKNLFKGKTHDIVFYKLCTPLLKFKQK